MKAVFHDNAHQPHQPSGTNESWDELVQRCWYYEECWDCLGHNPCSWCPSSGTCVPNTVRFPLLAPIFNPDVCSLWSERWEVRTTTLGCHVSTISLLTCIISVLSTFVVIGLVAISVRAIRWFLTQWKARPDGWWKVWKYYHLDWWKGWKFQLIDISRTEEGEGAPLLV